MVSRDSGLGLVADVGGTNVRFGLADLSAERLSISGTQHFAVREFPSMADAARTYLDGCRPDRPIRSAAFAVAGPVTHGEIHFTNSNWSFSEAGMARALGGIRVRLLNDFEAVARAVPHLQSKDIVTVGPQRTPDANALRRTYAILGPGTGLGVAGLVRTPFGDVPLVTEGGHADFAPMDDLQVEIWRRLHAEFEHVSLERILCGAGLVNLHAALADIDGVNVPTPKPEDITAGALHDPSSFAGRVFGVFCAILGSAAGDIALTMGARDGVYLAGGILPDAVDFLQNSEFRTRFVAKGRFREYLDAIPTHLIVGPYLALLGAAARLKNPDAS